LYVACRDHHLVEVGFDVIAEGLREMTISSFELQVPKDMKLHFRIGGETRKLSLADLGDVGALRRTLEENGISICALLLRNDFGSSSIEDEVRYVVEACTAGKAIGVKVARIDPAIGERPELSPRQQAELAAKPIAEVLRKVEGVDLAAENHGSIANRPEFLNTLFDKVGSDRLGLTLDPGNLYWFGYPASEVLQIVDEFAPKVKHTHMKNGRAPVGAKESKRKIGEIEMTPIYQGEVDLGMVVAILRKAGYKRDLTVEDESLAGFRHDEGKSVLKKDIEHLRSFIE